MVFEFFVPGVPRHPGRHRRGIRHLRHGARWRLDRDAAHAGRGIARSVAAAVRARARNRIPLHGGRARRGHARTDDPDGGGRGAGAHDRRRNALSADWPARRRAGYGARTTTSAAALSTRSKRSTHVRSSSRRSNRRRASRTWRRSPSMDGIDCLWVGHNDLSIQMGLPGEFQHPAFHRCHQTRGGRGQPASQVRRSDGERRGRRGGVDGAWLSGAGVRRGFSDIR